MIGSTAFSLFEATEEFSEIVLTLYLTFLEVLMSGDLELDGDCFEEMVAVFEFLAVILRIFLPFGVAFKVGTFELTSSVWVSACAFSTKRAFFSSLSSV